MTDDTNPTTDAPNTTNNNDDDDDDTNTDNGDGDVQAVEVVQPDASLDADTAVEDSPVEKAKSTLAEDLHREFTAASDDHPLVVTAGSKDALQSSANVALIKELSDGIYADSDAFWREWAQNHIAAVVREAKRRVKNQHGRDALYRDILHDHPDADGERVIRLPKSSREILAMARDLGYIPSIEFTIDHDDGRIQSRDNGIGMTTGEVIDVWNEPAESGSRKDLSSAGTKGLGALTWISVSGEEGGAIVETRTRREETLSGQPVPQRDRDGFAFFSYLGGVLPVSRDVPDGFYGTRFDIPITDSLNPSQFKGQMEQYTDVLPVQISWVEVSGGQRSEEEFPAQGFFDRYDEEPAIQLDRPGEFRVALDSPDIVPKGHSTDTAFLLDNPIQRNVPYAYQIDGLWNDHIQILNEQGLIVAGPNRGRRRDEVEELAGSRSDIGDESKPMPDVPVPEPVTSRDSLQQGEAMERFFTYLDHLIEDAELQRVDDYINGLLDCDNVSAAVEYVRDRGTEYELFVKLLKHHSQYDVPKKTPKLMDWLDSRDSIDFTLAAADDTDSGSPATVDYSTHPQFEVLDFLTGLQQEVDAYKTRDLAKNPDKSGNRTEMKLWKVLITEDQWPIYVGAKLNHDRVRTLLNTKPDAAVLKVNRYSLWMGAPWHAAKVKNVPFTKDEAEDADEDWAVPDDVHDRHASQSTFSGVESVDVSGNPLRVRTTENQSVDIRLTVEEFTDALDASDFGQPLPLESAATDSSVQGHPWTVVFPPGSDHENISDHYHLSQYANIINVQAAEAEELRQYGSVFLVDEFEAFLADTRVPFYAPESGAYSKGRIKTLRDWAGGDGRTLVLRQASNEHLDAVLYDKPSLSSEASDDSEVWTRQREAGFEKLQKRYSLSNPLRDDCGGSWRVVRYGQLSRVEKRRLHRYLSLTTDIVGHRGNLDTNVVFYLGRERSVHVPDNIRSKNPSHLGRVLRRAKYPGWAADSEAWTRLTSTYRGPEEYEKALLRACRELGVDPTTVEPDRLEQLVVMLATTSPEN